LAGKPGRSGRHHTIANVMRQFEATVDKSLIDIVYGQVEKAKSGSTEAARLLLEYRFGKPKQQIDIDMNLPNVDTIAMLYRQSFLEARSDYLLTEGESVPADDVSDGEIRDSETESEGVGEPIQETRGQEGR